VHWPDPVDATGSGTSEEGGGPLDGGLLLVNRMTVSIDDPAVPYDIDLTVAAVGGALAAEAVTLRRRADGPAVTGTALRGLVVDTYISRVREDLGQVAGGFLLTRVTASGKGVRTRRGASTADVEAFDAAQRRDGPPLTPALVAAYYREALASDDDKVRRAPTAAVGRWLLVHRGHAARMVGRARAEGHLGPARPGRAGERSPR